MKLTGLLRKVVGGALIVMSILWGIGLVFFRLSLGSEFQIEELSENWEGVIFFVLLYLFFCAVAILMFRYGRKLFKSDS
ncbi:MAG: hypothetical protein AAGC43_00285 [Bacteroidota bacterium]